MTQASNKARGRKRRQFRKISERDQLRARVNLKPKYDQRVEYFDDLTHSGPESQPQPLTAYYAYLNPGWACRETLHLVEAEFVSRNATIGDIRRAVQEQTRRCYCDTCLCTDEAGTTEEARKVAGVLRVRRTLAGVNGIPLDGSDENEAKIDKLILEASE
jgi:hypothetical protein